MQIRPVRDGDVAAICPLLADLGYPSDEAAVRVRLANLDRAGGYACLVAEEDERLLGLILLAQAWMIEMDGMQVRIVALVVDENARGRGIGVALMDEAEHWAREQGATALQLNSGTHRPEAHAFYRQRGYSNNGLRFYKKIGDGK